MATATLEPNGDVGTNEWTPTVGPLHYEDVDGGTDGVLLATNTATDEEHFEMTAVAARHGLTSEMYLEFRGSKSAADAGTVSFHYSINDGSDWIVIKIWFRIRSYKIPSFLR